MLGCAIAPGETVMETTVSTEIVVELPRLQVWQRLRDLSLAHHYVPGLTDTRIVTAQTEGVGTSRQVFQRGMAPLDETVIEWNEGYGFVLRLHRGERPLPPFRQARFVYAIEDAGPGATRFRPAMVYELPWGWLGRLLDRLILRRISQRMLARLAASFKRYYETGTPSNPLPAG
jgi:hypothetical protein